MKKENLHNIKHSGFKTPKDYFNTLEDQITSQIKVKAIVPNAGFKTPDDYFENLETTLIKASQQKTKVIPLFSKKIIVAVASIAAITVLYFNLNNTTKITFDTLDTDTVENYILDEIELSDLSSLIDTEQLSQTDFINYNDVSLDKYIDDIDLEELLQE